MTAPATEWRPPAAPPAAPHRRAAGRAPVDRSWLWSTPPVLILAVVFLYPLLVVFKRALEGAPGTGFTAEVSFGGTLSDAGSRTAMWNTVQIAVYSTVGCLVLGFVLALIVAFVPFPGAKGVSKFIDVFLSFPSFLITVAIMFVYGRVGMVNGLVGDLAGGHREPLNFIYTPWGIWFGEVIYFTPFVMRPLLSAFSQLDTGQLEVASSLGARPLRIIRQIILPEALPAMFAGGSLVLLLTMNEYGIVAFTGAKYQTLPVLIANFATEQGNVAGACALAVVNIAMSLVMFALYRVLLARISGGRRAAVVA
jgi:2-aminoethylphosphonate transport system permease protein